MRLARTALLGSFVSLGFAGICAVLGPALQVKTAESPQPKARAGSRTPIASTPKPTIEFNRDVRPILAARCWPCHSANKEALKSTKNMRLDTFAGATQDRGGYRAISPGKPDESFAFIRASSDNADIKMPPPTSGFKPLSITERKIIRQWILEGAQYRAHWAFQVPKMPALPVVKNPGWVRNPIDNFVLAKLEEEGLSPEPEADKPTLIRRASLTLTGLPPTPEEVNAFLADKRPDAYERVVDRLLASPRYGEHEARYWMDAVRYGDTHGLHIDNERAVYPYRDWVVRALNEDLPFDQFTIWQIAGDLLPEPTTEQRIATGYVRMNPTTNEGGVIEEEFLAKNTFDRVETTSTVFMGLTMTCARCHDHKYDPLTQRDYYGLFAFFNGTADAPLDGNLKLHMPVMKAPTPEEDKVLKDQRSRLDAMEDSTDLEIARTWIAARFAEIPVAGQWEVSSAQQAKDFDSAYATDFGPEPGGEEKTVEWKPVEIKDGVPKDALIEKENAAAYLRSQLTVQSASEFTLRLGSDDAIKVWVNGELSHENKVLRALAPNQDSIKVKLKAGSNAILVKIINAGGLDGFAIGYGDILTGRISKIFPLAQKGGLSTSERRELASLYLEAGPETEAATTYRKALKDYRTLDEMIPFTYVAQELPNPRTTYILKRGEYSKPGALTWREFPKVFGGMPPGIPKNRLGLAKWLVSPQNPLTARVTVNRIWQQHFGTGIVKTSEDFGSRGEWPSHPELLDYLAVRFEKDGWSMKKLHRLIVTSATFRQKASASKEKWAHDPENRLLARGPRFRLDAEVIRDSALFNSGLLVEKIGGHGDKPYQPPGLWEIISFAISDTAKYMQDHGDALHRRSLYLFWKRTSPPVNMLILDAPMRESCVVRRSRTNTPTQALTTLNDPTFVEAARAMAQRVMTVKSDDRARANYAFRLATGRQPTDAELNVIIDSYRAQLKEYGGDKAAAIKLLSIGESPRNEKLDPAEHAAWTMTCNLLLNLDEALTQH